ncbi:hypothetical protein DWV13_16870 [Clostridium botulinum]|uniref:hypothetical protein n=1 Tax=Clostridium TaxID=1485 RepID=UPI0013FB84F4|nr:MULTISPECIES: hypothetical protein [Clostridium]MCS6133261.1 hypothetical protein [Clostridium botulinum]NFL46726.1 hypothetical protein [Clostridium botulinum]NFL91174.1 hypothetical protein [Clostridium botulinum]
MNLKNSILTIEKQVESQINQNNTTLIKPRLLIDEKRLGQTLKSYYKQDLNNLTLPLNAIKNIALNPVSLVEFAKLNAVSYSSIFQNKEAYVTLIKTLKNQNNTYTVAEYELCHSLRANVWGDRSEYLVKNNKIATKKLIALSNLYDTDPGTAVFKLIMNLDI